MSPRHFLEGKYVYILGFYLLSKRPICPYFASSSRGALGGALGRGHSIGVVFPVVREGLGL